MSRFVKYALGYDTATVAMESSLFEVYVSESCEYEITKEDFKQKLKNAGHKVAETLRRWMTKIKEFFKSVWNWITRHWNAFVAKFTGKKKVPDPKALEDANTAFIQAHNCLVKANAATDAKVAETAMAEAQDYFELGYEKLESANENKVEANPEQVKTMVAKVNQKFAKTGEEMVELALTMDSKRGEYVKEAIVNKARAAGVHFMKAMGSLVKAVVGKTDDPTVDDKATVAAQPAAATA